MINKEISDKVAEPNYSNVKLGDFLVFRDGLGFFIEKITAFTPKGIIVDKLPAVTLYESAVVLKKDRGYLVGSKARDNFKDYCDGLNLK